MTAFEFSAQDRGLAQPADPSHALGAGDFCFHPSTKIQSCGAVHDRRLPLYVLAAITEAFKSAEKRKGRMFWSGPLCWRASVSLWRRSRGRLHSEPL